MDARTDKTQIRLTRASRACWRVALDNPPLNIMGPQMVREFPNIVSAIETDEDLKVVVFECAVA